MWYVIEGYDGTDVLAARLASRPAHLARLQALQDEGRLLLAGPCPAIDSEDPGPAGFSGSVVIAAFADPCPGLGRRRSVRGGRCLRPRPGPSVPQGPAVNRVERIRQALQEALDPELLEVKDDSHRHAGHEGARDGRGHFKVHVVSAAFEGKLPLARHRAVYAALGTMMETDIHALSIRAETPVKNR